MGESDTSLAPRLHTAPERFWEDLITGDRIRSNGITVTEAHLVTWAGLTGDIVSLHLDAEYAATTPFGERIGHGGVDRFGGDHGRVRHNHSVYRRHAARPTPATTKARTLVRPGLRGVRSSGSATRGVALVELA